MKEDGGYPAIGETSSYLYVRVPFDIEPDEEGLVNPGTGGLSVAPNLSALPPERIPQSLEHIVAGAKGNRTHRVWVIGSGGFLAGTVCDGLSLRPDPDDANHGFIEPEQAQPLEAFQASVLSSRTKWRVAAEEDYG